MTGVFGTGARRLGAFFALYSPALDRPVEGGGDPSGSSALGGVRWRWVLTAGAGVGIITYLSVEPVIYGYLLIIQLLGWNVQSVEQSSVQLGYLWGAWGMPITHALLTLFATSWVARRIGTAAVTHGVLIALFSVLVNQAIVLLFYESSLSLVEVATYLVMALWGGLLGGVESRSALTGQEAFYRASRDISAAHEPQTVVDAIGDYLASSAVDGVALWQTPVRVGDEPRNGSPEISWKPWFSRGWPTGVGFGGLDVPALAEGESPRTLRARELPARERVVWRSRGIRSAFLLPLVAPGGARVGLLVVVSRGRKRLPRGVLRACFTVGAQAALVLENLRLLEEARRAGKQAGVLRERQRMAHEIHDTLAQGFTSIVMNLEAAEGTLALDQGRARRHLDQAQLTARESLMEARRLVWALRPGPLEKASLPEALSRLVERWKEESGVAADLTVTGTPRPLSPEIEATLFRTAQEALANVRKHARASRVALTLSYMGDCVALDARDDGAGFDPLQRTAEDRSSGGFGLKGMRERIEQAGGSLSIESAPGEGSTLAVELPMIVEDAASPEEEAGAPEPSRVTSAGRLP